jgi:hypothetical protein
MLGQTALMSAPQLFTGEQVMAKVAAALPKRGNTLAAVAYVTRDHLGLGLGDRLAVNAGLPAVRSGATSPTLLLHLLEAGVDVVNQPKLHAKAIVRANTVAIGSANLSGRTSRLQELMWVTRDEVLLRRTRTWLEELLKPAPMTRIELERLIPQFSADAPPGGRERLGGSGHEPASTRTRRADPFAPRAVTRVWLWRDEPAPTAPPAALEAEAGPVEESLSGREWIRNHDVANTREGDVWIRYGRGRLHPPRKVLIAVSTTTSRGGGGWTLNGFRAEDRAVPIPGWVRDAYGELTKTEHVEVTNATEVAKLLDLWK